MEDRSGGRHGERARLKNQMERLFTCSVQLIYTESDHKVVVSSFVAERAEFWWSAREPNAPSLWDSRIELGEKFFNEIIAHPIPIDLHTLKALKRSPLGLDLYFWLVYRTFTLRQPLTLSWRQIYRQFGAHPADGPADISGFRRQCLRELKKSDAHGRTWAITPLRAHWSSSRCRLLSRRHNSGSSTNRRARHEVDPCGAVPPRAGGVPCSWPGGRRSWAAQRPVRAAWEFPTKWLLIAGFSVG